MKDRFIKLRRLILFVTVWVISFVVSLSGSSANELQDGDLIFHCSKSRQSAAIMAATDSVYTHIGVIFYDDGKPFVYEAVQPVKKTALNDWIARGVANHYVVKRVKGIDAKAIAAVKAEVLSWMGKDYDLVFEWTDDRLYCSELVWKAFKRGAGVEVGNVKALTDFKIDHPVVRELITERYGDAVPVRPQLISPGDQFESELLETVRWVGEVP